MKKIISILVLSLIVFGVNAQENPEPKPENKRNNDEVQTLFKKARPLGFYVGWSNKPIILNDQFGFCTGAEVALSFGRKLNMGVAAYGLVSPVQSNVLDQNGNIYYYDMAYGGFLIEPVIGSNKLLHVTLPIILGAGGVSYHTQYNSFSNWENYYDYQSGIFFIAEPGVHAELNLFKWLRFHTGVSYRFTGPGYFSVPQNGELNGWSASLGLKIGLF